MSIIRVLSLLQLSQLLSILILVSYLLQLLSLILYTKRIHLQYKTDVLIVNLLIIGIQSHIKKNQQNLVHIIIHTVNINYIYFLL